MKTLKFTRILILFSLITFIIPSCWLLGEEEPEEDEKCGPKQEVLGVCVDIEHPVTIANYITQDGTWSYYEFPFPSVITDPELCVEEHCQLEAVLFMHLFYDDKIRDLKVEGMIEIGFTGHPMTFVQSGTAFQSDNDFGLKQAFSNEDFGWIYGSVKLSFKTFGTYEEEILELNKKIGALTIALTYYQSKQ